LSKTELKAVAPDMAINRRREKLLNILLDIVINSLFLNG